MATRDLERLAKHVKAHRMELYSSRLAAAEAATISKDTWQRVEEGESVRESTYAKIDKALGWASGSCVTVAEGGEPMLVTGRSEAPAEEVRRRLTAEEVRSMAFDAARAKLPGAPIGDIDAFSEELVEELKRRGFVAEAP
ncbi:hypothetical protein ACH4UM_18580 [Streptomyces sp. NPDC020801]|uniref:hypothetical protein n=1 Tax=Streptomyces sp. NPDC020801 TaxID=3365093 RepID=UPI0037ADFB22